jgi:tight adherence protein B
MSLLVIAVFAAVFAIVLLLSMSIDSSGVQARKQTKERLDSISMAVERQPEDEGVGLLREELLSSAPWFYQWLQRQNLFAGLRNLLNQADMKWTVGGVVVMSLASWVVVGVAVYLRTNTPLLSVMLGAIGAISPSLYISFKRSQRFDHFERGLPDALDLMVSALRAGHSFISAIESVAREMPKPLGEEFRKCFDEQNFGLEMRESLLNLAARVPIHDVHIIVTAILIQKESGGNLAEILEKVAHIIRQRFRLKKQVRVHTAQGRLTGLILTLLPLVLGVAMYLVNPEHMSILWESATGLKLIYTSVIMTVIGGLIIRKIVNIRI